jgi:3-methyl-2-oxobutanoate hydroxymethyltransferase
MPEDRITVERVRGWPEGRRLLALTAYDYPLARHLDEAGIDILHVGDSLGMVVLGMEDTTGVTLDDMVRATAAVARGRQRALVTADLPIGTYQTEGDAVAASRALVAAGAEAVKMEGGGEIIGPIRAVLAAGMAVQGHLGMLPQHVKEEGGYKKKGKTAAEAERLLGDAKLLEEAGVFSIVLEAVVPAVAERVTRALKIPTLGIASGTGTRGQIRVTHDVLGLTPWYDFPFAERELEAAALFGEAARRWMRRFVKEG